MDAETVDRLDQILDDKGYEINYKNVKFTVDELVLFKRLLDGQRDDLSKVLEPFFAKYGCLPKDVEELKVKVYEDHEARILRIEKRLFWRKVGAIAAAVAVCAIILVIVI